MSTWPGWESAVLHELGLPDTASNRRFLATWQRFEGGKARYNPLNTTKVLGTPNDYNSVGVQNYGSAAVGARATAATLRDPRYSGIVNTLRTGRPSGSEALSRSLQVWVSGSPTGNPSYAEKILKAFGGGGVSSSRPAAPLASGAGCVFLLVMFGAYMLVIAITTVEVIR